MLRTEYARLLYFFIGSSGYLVPRSVNENIKISKTMHPYLLGKRNSYYFYNLEKSLYGIRASLEVLKNIIEDNGEILFVSDLPALKYAFGKNPNINCINLKRSSLANSGDSDLIFLSGVRKENLVEAHRKCTPLVGVGSFTMSKIAYPFNLNIDSILLSYWFFNAIYATCDRGNKIKGVKKKSPFISLLGQGISKKSVDSTSISLIDNTNYKNEI
uniref:Ribosomal protein S2 n=1 Tax=Desmarestia viridis TaxID=62313 RepID=Q2TUG9_9PHAE|nr:ribosomal protein S2 [Desmarestia viridis]AAS79028.1 ribosomal protein S2 [Desmarestia viridis]